MDIIEVETLLEGISKEQKEAGQRAMNMEYSKISYRLDEYFNKKWSGKKIKEDYMQMAKEKKRLAIVKKVLKLGPALSGKKSTEYIKNTLGYEPEARTKMSKFGSNSFSQRFKSVYLTNSKRSENAYSVPVGGGNFDYVDKNFEEYSKIWNKMIALHEYTHVFDYLKNYIENGKADLGVKYTEQMNSKVKDVEGSAMAGETDLLYRKDRRTILKNQERQIDTLRFPHSKKAEEEYEKALDKSDPNRSRYINAIYLKGRYEQSKTLAPTLKSLNVEELYKKFVKFFNFAMEDFKDEVKQFNDKFGKEYEQKISLPNIRFAVIPHDKAKAPVFAEHNKIYVDVYAGRDFREHHEYLLYKYIRELLFNKYPELAKNDERFVKYFERNPSTYDSYSESFSNYRYTLYSIEKKDVYEK